MIWVSEAMYAYSNLIDKM